MSKDYRKAPRVESALMPRYKAVAEVLAGVVTVSEAARRLKLSRNRFQSVMHRAMDGLVAGLRVKKPGRPARPQWEQALREEAERLRRENERLTKEAQSTERLLSLARGLLASTRKSSPEKRARVKRPKTEDE